MRRLWQVSRFEFRISIVALVGVLLLGILKGVLLAAIASFLMLLAAPRARTSPSSAAFPARGGIPTSSATRTTRRFRAR